MPSVRVKTKNIKKVVKINQYGSIPNMPSFVLHVASAEGRKQSEAKCHGIVIL